MANELEDIAPPPWAKQAGPQLEDIAPPSWATKPEQRGGVLSEAARPITTYWPSVKEVQREAGQQVVGGVERLTKPTGGDLAESAKSAILGPVGVVGGAIQYGISPITGAIRSFLSRPLEETTGLPKEYTEFATELAIPGIGLTRPPRIPYVTRTPTPKGPEAEAGRLLEFQIKKEGGDPEAVRQALQQPIEEIVPGSKPTTFQQTGDLGAGQVERGATTRHPAAFQERFGEQNAARLEAIEKLQAAGSPEEVATHLRNAMRVETAQADDGVRLAQQRAWEESQQVGGTYDPTTYGNVFRRELQQAEEAARASERELWRAVDPDGTLRANPQPMQELERGIYGPESMSQAGAASITPAEREITALIQNYPPVIPFQELRDLRSLTSTALREELYTRGQTPAYARLSRLRQGIEDAIPRSFTEEGAAATGVQERLRAASAATRERAETFRPLRDVTRREGTQGPYRMGEASVPGRIVQSGARGYDSASSYLRAVGNERGLPDLQDAVAASMRREVIGPDGTINPRKLDGWLKRYQDTLRAIDERDGGAFSQRLRNLGTAQETLDTAIARQTAISKQQGKDALANIIGSTEEADITRMIVGILGKHDSVQRMGELVRRLSGNDAALEGARRAVVEHLRTRLLSNMEAAATGKPIIKAEQFQNFVKHNKPALQQLMTPEQMQSLLDIARDIQQRSNRTVQTGIRGRSTTEQDRRIMREQEESALKAGAKQIGTIAGKGLVDLIASFIPGGPFGVRAGEAVLKAQMEKWRARGINTIQELVDEAMLNPEVAREILSKTHRLRTHNRFGRPIGGIRAPFQAGGGVPAIGGTGGRSLGTTTPPGPRAARAGTGQALSDGGEAGEQPAAPLSGSRERFAAALAASPAGGGAFGSKLAGKTGAEKKKPSPLGREDIVKQLQGRGLSTEGWGAPTGATGESRVPAVDSRAEGGDVDEPAPADGFSGFRDMFDHINKMERGEAPLPLPGQSRGLRSTAGPTVTSTTPEADIPAPKTNKAGETLPTYILKSWGQGMVDLAKTPGRVYREGMTDEDIDFGPKMALTMMGANAPAAASRPGIGMFGGRGAKTANLDALKKAEEMHADPVKPSRTAHRESIWNQTGWFRDPAGDWMFEIPDTGSYVKPTERIYPSARDMASRPSGYASNVPLEDVLHHPRYFEAYPQFKDMPTTLELGVAPGGGYMPPGNLLGPLLHQPGIADVGRMEIRAPHANEGAGGKHGDYPARRIILHEGMHGVQGAEGFTVGGNPNALPYSPRQITNMAKKQAEEAGIPWELLQRDDKAKLVSGMRMSIYKSLLGEAWARAVEARRNMTPEALMHRPPWKDLDVPWGDVRIPKDEGVALGLRPTGRVSPWRKPESFAEGGAIDWEEDKLQLPADTPDAFEAAAARVRRRYPTREPDPVSLKASGIPGQRGMPFSHWLPSEERAREESTKVLEGEDYNPRDAFLSSIGVVGSPVGSAVKGAGTVLGAGAVRTAKPAAKAVEAVAPKAPEVPMLLGNPELRGSMSTTENMPFTYRGKGPAEWTPQEFEEVGQHFGVPRLGPESPPKAFKYSDGETFNIPGGLEGQFTYYDMLAMKAQGIDPSRIPRELHTKLHQKLMRSMDVEQPVSPERTWSGLMFGMTSPNNPLFPNQLTQSILRMREPGLRKQLADQIPWQVGDKVSKEERLAASDRIADMFGLSAASKGGLGVRGSQDYSRIGELAQMWERNPEWFTKTAEESWPNYVERLTSQVTGTSMKTGSFGSVWQDPGGAGISAIDRHMVNEFERTGKLFPTRAEQKAFEQRAVERWNNANEDRPVKTYRQLQNSSGGEGFLTKMKLEYVGAELHTKFRTPKGEISPRVPEHLARTDWPSEPTHVKTMGGAYRRALDWNQELANRQGLNLFPSQWLEWDRIRRRFEPHENMFPGLERMPAMSRDQLRAVSAEHTASGHKAYGKVEGEEGQMNLPPTRPRPNPASFAYFQMPPIGGLPGIARRVYGEKE